MGLLPVADDMLAAVVTTLEMTARPAPRPRPASELTLVRRDRPALTAYRALFRRVGAPWLWYSRLALSDAQLAAIVHDPAVEVHAAIDPAGTEVGLLELDFRQPGACELGYFALVPELAGRGHGRWLMAEALTRAWRPDVGRIWLHTCSLDHPAALNFYRAQGFAPIRRTIETFPDPRLTGLLPPDAAPQIPCLGPARRR